MCGAGCQTDASPWLQYAKATPCRSAAVVCREFRADRPKSFFRNYHAVDIFFRYGEQPLHANSKPSKLWACLELLWANGGGCVSPAPLDILPTRRSTMNKVLQFPGQRLLRFDRLLSELLAQRSPQISLTAFVSFFCCPISPTTRSQAVAHRRVPRPEPAGPEKDRPATPTDRDRRTILPQQGRQCRQRPVKL